jgi:hypothetical protein
LREVGTPPLLSYFRTVDRPRGFADKVSWEKMEILGTA